MGLGELRAAEQGSCFPGETCEWLLGSCCARAEQKELGEESQRLNWAIVEPRAVCSGAWGRTRSSGHRLEQGTLSSLGLVEPLRTWASCCGCPLGDPPGSLPTPSEQDLCMGRGGMNSGARGRLGSGSDTQASPQPSLTEARRSSGMKSVSMKSAGGLEPELGQLLAGAGQGLGCGELGAGWSSAATQRHCGSGDGACCRCSARGQPCRRSPKAASAPAAPAGGLFSS